MYSVQQKRCRTAHNTCLRDIVCKHWQFRACTKCAIELQSVGETVPTANKLRKARYGISTSCCSVACKVERVLLKTNPSASRVNKHCDTLLMLRSSTWCRAHCQHVPSPTWSAAAPTWTITLPFPADSSTITSVMRLQNGATNTVKGSEWNGYVHDMPYQTGAVEHECAVFYSPSGSAVQVQAFACGPANVYSPDALSVQVSHQPTGTVFIQGTVFRERRYNRWHDHRGGPISHQLLLCRSNRRHTGEAAARCSNQM